jgi:hypothetical protein
MLHRVHLKGVIMPEYTKREHRQFVEDMEAAGLEIRHYEGRNFYQGPAVMVDDLGGDHLGERNQP